MKKKAEKLVAGLLCMTMAISVFAGCGSSDTEEETSEVTAEISEGEEDDEETVVEVEETEFEEYLQDGSSVKAVEVDGNYLFDKLICSVSTDGAQFDPFVGNTWSSIHLNSLIYQKLANVDAYGNLYYCMLKSVEEVDDTHYRLVLWDCIYDSEGNHITASDVDFSFQQIIANGRGGSISKFDHFDIEDDYSLVWVCSSPFTMGEFEKQLSNVVICSQAAYEASGETGMSSTPVGTGPYVLSSYVPGSTVVLEANENYWMRNLSDDVKSELYATEAQNVKTLEFQIIQDSATRAIALEMGTIDVADALDGADVDVMYATGDYSLVTMPETAPFTLSFNCDEQSVCSDLRIRQAICYALDTEKIVNGISLPGEAAGCLLPNQADTPDEWLTEEYADSYYAYDLDKAHELMEEAGYDGEKIEIVYIDSNPRTDMVIMIQSQLQSAGFNVDITALDAPLLDIAVTDPSEFDIRILTMGGGYYVSNAVSQFAQSEVEQTIGNGLNINFVSDDKLEELIKAENEDNSVENINALADYITFDQCYAYSILTYSKVTLCSDEIDGSSLYTYELSPNAATPAK